MAAVVTTYLELTDPDGIRPARPVPIDVRRVDPPDGAVNRRFYETVGGPWQWTDKLGNDAAWWQARAAEYETWVLAPDAGYYELHPVDGDVEVVSFGLVPDFHGRGQGGALLEHALRRGFELGHRVWLHTCTLDSPRALPNYRARGLVPFRVAQR